MLWISAANEVCSVLPKCLRSLGLSLQGIDNVGVKLLNIADQLLGSSFVQQCSMDISPDFLEVVLLIVVKKIQSRK